MSLPFAISRLHADGLELMADAIAEFVEPVALPVPPKVAPRSTESLPSVRVAVVGAGSRPLVTMA